MTPEHVGQAAQVAEVASGAVQHTAVTNFTWSAVLLSILNLLVGGALVTWVKTRPKMKELEQSADAKLIDTLSARVEQLERRMEADREKFEGKLEAERQRHEVEASLLRHRANNADQCTDALLLVLENADGLSDQVKRAIISVKDMRTRQRREEALEKGAIAGAKIAAAPTIA